MSASDEESVSSWLEVNHGSMSTMSTASITNLPRNRVDVNTKSQANVLKTPMKRNTVPSSTTPNTLTHLVSPESVQSKEQHVQPKAATATATATALFEMRRIRTVSPEPLSSNKNDSNKKVQVIVFIANSMRGKCYHHNKDCYGLRRAQHGICTISHQGALLRGMRACKVCQLSSRQRQQEQHDDDDLDAIFLLDPQLSPPIVTTSSKTLYEQQEVQSKELQKHSIKNDVGDDKAVFVASSLKGKCFHSTSYCKGLRNAIGGSITISMKNAFTMEMRPCQICCNDETAMFGNISIALPFTTTQKHSSGLLSASSTKSHVNNEVQSILPPANNTHQISTCSSSSIIGGNSIMKERSIANTTCKFYTTASGKCYHQKRTCSSLKRSKNIVEQLEKPLGKNPCKLCF